MTARRPQFLAAWIVAAVVIAFYLWTAATAGSPFRWTRSNTSYYNLLADGFRAHHLYLAVAPAPELLALPDPYDPAATPGTE